MKLLKIKEIAEKSTMLKEKKQQAYEAYTANPTNANQRAYMLASAAYSRAVNTLENYRPIFKVTIGEFLAEVENYYAARGKVGTLGLSYAIEDDNNLRRAGFNLCVLDKNGELQEKYEIFEATIDDENAPVKDAKIDLLKTKLVKSCVMPVARRAPISNDFFDIERAQVEDVLNIISWDCIAKKLNKQFKEDAAAKAKRKAEREAKRKMYGSDGKELDEETRQKVEDFNEWLKEDIDE